ncbi:hypothetical protein ACYOEI_26300 [Singulisphaera rosea]
MSRATQQPGWATLLAVLLVIFIPSLSRAAAELRFDKPFLAGVIEKLPPTSFQKDGQYRGTVDGFRLLAIEPKSRRFLVACQVSGEFKAPVANPLKKVVSRDKAREDDWKGYRFDVQLGINIEAGLDGTPRFRFEVEEIKRRELEGFAGILAKFLGSSFDALVTQVADGKTSRLNEKLNAEVMKHAKAFKEYGVFQGIEYTPMDVVLRFDVSRYKYEGITGYVYAEAQPGTQPLYRWVHRRGTIHLFTTGTVVPDRRIFLPEGIACYVLGGPQAETLPVYGWRRGGDQFFTLAPDGEGIYQKGYHPEGIAFHVDTVQKPGTVPLYRFVDPRAGRHFFTTHPHAEFAK